MANTTSESAGQVSLSAGRKYCSEISPEESLWGTADPVDVWICLEYKSAWKAKAMADNALTGATRDWLSSTLAALEAIGLKGRPQFVRQPESERAETRLLVSRGAIAVEFSGSGYDFLAGLQLAALLEEPATMAASVEAAGGTIMDQPHYLVCTNGQRDLCCARFGLPTYTALRERLGDRVWQVTHLGGHRFAPNVLVLPDACLYGRVAVDGVDEFLSWTEAGEVDFSRLRGRTCYPALVQAGEACLGRQGLRLMHVSGDEAQASVRFAAAAEQLTVSIGRATQPLIVTKSCGDETLTEVFPFVETPSN